MRTTVTLDPDVEAKLRALMRERGISFKEALNSAIRAGLAMSRASSKRFKLQTYRMGLRPDVSLTKALSLAADLEDEEIARKLELRK
ncbi:MAG: antitoxin [Chloroflexi bacterium]|nr:antitoxin [Chloroflexota bacterium]